MAASTFSLPGIEALTHIQRHLAQDALLISDAARVLVSRGGSPYGINGNESDDRERNEKRGQQGPAIGAEFSQHHRIVVQRVPVSDRLSCKAKRRLPGWAPELEEAEAVCKRLTDLVRQELG